MTDHDRDLNRRGLISARQREALEARSTHTRIWAALAPVMLLLNVARIWGSASASRYPVLVGIGAPMLLYLVYRAVRERRMRRRVRVDFAAGILEHGDGVVQFRRGTMSAALDSGRPLLLGGALAPGRYRFHYLPRSGRVLSADEQGHGPRAGASPLTRAVWIHAAFASICGALAGAAMWPYLTGVFDLDPRGIVDGPLSVAAVFVLAAAWFGIEATVEHRARREARVGVVRA